MPIDLSKMILIDHHVHSLHKEFSHVDKLALRQAFSESGSVVVLEEHVQNSIPYAHMLGELGEFLDACGEERVIELRNEIPADAYVEMLFDDASIGGLIVDDGFDSDRMLDLKQFAHLAQRPVYRCLRIETALEEALAISDSFEDLKKAFMSTLKRSSTPRVVALKTIAAYRGGLDIDLALEDAARRDFDRARRSLTDFASVRGRITRSPLYHYFLLEAFELAGERKLPVQVHSGLGDRDADLRESNPLCFRSVLESRRFAKTNFVFLHTYPFVRETSLLASLYANVFFDLSLAAFIASPMMETMFFEALSTAPSTKILAGSDGHSVPETFWYASRSLRRGLAGALARLVDGAYLAEDLAMIKAGHIFHANAQRLYQLES